MYKIYKHKPCILFLFMRIADLQFLGFSMHRRRMMKVFQLFDVETSEPRLLTYTHHHHHPLPNHRRKEWMDANIHLTQREHLETEILQNSSELGNQY